MLFSPRNSKQKKGRWPNGVLTLGHRLRRWPSVKPALGQRLAVLVVSLLKDNRPVIDNGWANASDNDTVFIQCCVSAWDMWAALHITRWHDNTMYWTSTSEAVPLEMNKWGFTSPLCTYRLNWAKRTSWGWWDEWDDLQTQDSKFDPLQSEAEHATFRSRRLPTILNHYERAGKKHFVSLKLECQSDIYQKLEWQCFVFKNLFITDYFTTDYFNLFSTGINYRRESTIDARFRSIYLIKQNT